MKKIFTTFGIFLFVVIYALGQQTEVLVNYYDNQKGAINVPQDKILVFNLPVKPSNGYVWQVANMKGNLLAQDPQLHYTASNEGIGSEGFSQLRFMTKDAGNINVKFVLLRPWENTPIEEVSYTVTSEGAYTGDVKFEDALYKAPKLKKEDYEVKSLPSTYSLISLGYLTTVKNQGSCGSCWAFAGCGVFESNIKRADNVTRDLSEQWMVNCGSSYGHNGCSGGWNPFDMYNNGAVYESSCSYQATDGTCYSYTKHEKIQSWAYVAGSSSVPSTTAIKQAIYDHGALWCAVASSGMSYYTAGTVWAGNGSSSVDHAVVLVGWDDYNQCWIMRNSWGTSWGEDYGYMRIRYGANSIGYAASYLVYQGSTTNDTQAPTAPSNLNSSNITSSSVTLSWSASSDNVGVTGYNVYRNGSLLGSVTGTSGNVTGLTEGTTYSFYVKATDAAGNLSYSSSTISVTTTGGSSGDTQAPTAPSNLSSSSITSSSVTLSWSASSDNVGVTGYNVYSNGSLLGSITSTSANVTGLTEGTTYSYYVKATDAAGNLSYSSNTISVTTSGGSVSTYCTSKGSNASYFWIDYVALGGMTNTTGSNSGYADFTSKVATVGRGASTTISLSCGFSGSSYTQYWHVWIDWDHNGTFDTDERMVYGSSSSSATLTGTFTVPSDAVIGTTRMRITMKYNAAATACETFSYGEVEDYTVYVGTSSYVNSFTDGNVLGNEAPTSINVYPNPATNYINVNISNGSKIGTISIHNMVGSLVKVVEIDGTERNIDISELPAGSYIISVEDEIELLTKQFIIK